MSTLTIAPSNGATTKTRLNMNRNMSTPVASVDRSPNLSAAAVAAMESFSFSACSPLGAPKFKLPNATGNKNEQDLRKSLNSVKHLYFERRYRQCAINCTKLLDEKCRDAHPLVRSYLFFYAAVSYDTLARSMHNRSRAKDPMLEQAGELYQKALTTLPAPTSIEQDYEPAKTTKVHFTSTGLVGAQLKYSDGTAMKENQHERKSEERTPTPRDARRDSVLSVFSWISGLKSHVDAFSDSDYAAHPSVKKPSPLRIRKNRSSQQLDQEKLPSSPTAFRSRPQSIEPPPMTPPFDKTPLAPILKTPTHQRTQTATSPPVGPRPTYNSTTTTAAIPMTPDHQHPGFMDSALRARLAKDDDSPHAQRSEQHRARVLHYNAELAAFHAMLLGHVDSVQLARKHLVASSSPAAAAAHGFSHPVAVPEPVSRNISDEERAARILRGRERGWQRQRWDGTRYEELRAKALGDL
ncbi:hypothetical protein IWX90DRAFT_505082 [Phyllosticta citrichinensis]|uniref:Uncharacterized protein n=1 Tax=Phyllosticta citrichinensis TaxID=1130410 RepID=A0ABR1XR97_9PEZI